MVYHEISFYEYPYLRKDWLTQNMAQVDLIICRNMGVLLIQFIDEFIRKFIHVKTFKMQWDHMIVQSVITWYRMHHSVSELSKDSSYSTLMGELWGVSCEHFGESWPCYNEFGLYRLSAKIIQWFHMMILCHPKKWALRNLLSLPLNQRLTSYICAVCIV